MSATRTDAGLPTAIGIDLGTTNSALAWTGDRGPIRIFDVPQLVAPGEIGRRPVLPSFLYLPTDAERATGAFAQPWDAAPASGGGDEAIASVAGTLAREHGALAPARQIASAKSWLANPSIDRTAAMLPWGVESGPRLSPVDASARILRHLRDAWNHDSARGDDRRRLERQTIVLTVPASFDEEARELTVSAAREAGFDDLRLLEEPLAAVYAWIAAHRQAAAGHLRDGHTLLVCDVGGGTTDFTMLRVADEGGAPGFERIAIGEHLLLGGDNLDLALAALVETKLLEQRKGPAGARLTVAERQTLRRKCSAAKEALLADGGTDDRVRITLLGSGRGVVSGGVSADLSRAEVVEAVERGFLPMTSAGDLPARDRRVALRELGLPYESEPAITRHLAAFLTRAGGGTEMMRPDAVLFNGGFFAPALARERVLDALEAWCGRLPEVLENARPEAAVAAGAAFYGRLRRNPGSAGRLLIRAGCARAYYIGVQAAGAPASGGRAAPQAVCVVPRGTQEGSTLTLGRGFTVQTNRPAAFTLYSTLRRDDAFDDVVTFSEADEARQHAPLVTSLRYGKRSRSVPLAVRLTAAFTETGTLELWCESVATDHRWRLSFNLRGAEIDPIDAQDVEETAEEAGQVVVDAGAVERAVALVTGVFSGSATGPGLTALTGELEAALGHGKHAWPLPAIRVLADALLGIEGARRRSADAEIRWLNLAGFCTRPGFGTALDSWRVSELRKVYAAGLAFPREVQCQVEWLVLWQRVGAGFSTGQQRELAQRVIGQLGLGQKKAPRLNPQIEREGWRLLASLERLDAAQRSRLGDDLLERVRRDPRSPSWLWCLGRLGGRTPLYGPLSSVVPPATAERWLHALISLKVLPADMAEAIVRIGVLTGDEGRDVSPEARNAAADRLRAAGHAEADALFEIRTHDPASAGRVFGESLPEGLRLEAVEAESRRA